MRISLVFWYRKRIHIRKHRFIIFYQTVFRQCTDIESAVSSLCVRIASAFGLYSVSCINNGFLGSIYQIQDAGYMIIVAVRENNRLQRAHGKV